MAKLGSLRKRYCYTWECFASAKRRESAGSKCVRTMAAVKAADRRLRKQGCRVLSLDVFSHRRASRKKAIRRPGY